MDLDYRPLTAGDATAWRDLRAEGAAAFPLGFLVTAEEARALSEGESRRILDDGRIRGVVAGDAPLGYCTLRHDPAPRIRHRAEIGPFYVALDHQGSGAARVLMEGVFAEAIERDHPQLELFVDTKNARAIRFYEKMGFRQVARHPDAMRIDGEARDAYLYIRHLG